MDGAGHRWSRRGVLASVGTESRCRLFPRSMSLAFVMNSAGSRLRRGWGRGDGTSWCTSVGAWTDDLGCGVSPDAGWGSTAVQGRRHVGEVCPSCRGRDGTNGQDRQRLRDGKIPRVRHAHVSGYGDDDGVEEDAGLAVQVGRLLSAGTLSRRQVVDGQARHAGRDGLGTRGRVRRTADVGQDAASAHFGAARGASQTERLLGRSAERRKRESSTPTMP